MRGTAKLIGALCLGVLGCGESASEPVELVGTFLTGVHPNNVAVGDFDGDGDPDIAAPGLLSPQIATLWNEDGELGYSLENPISEGAANALAYDLDGDGTDELLLGNRDWPAIEVLSASTGSWVRDGQIDLAGAEKMAAGDLDGDGVADLAVSRFEEWDVALLFNDGGAMSAPTLVPVDPGPQPLAILEGPEPAIAVGESSSDSLSLLEGTGRSWEVVRRIDTPGWPATLEWTDLDGDGLIEIVGTANTGHSIFVADRELVPLATSPAGQGCFGLAVIGDGRIAVTNKFEDTMQIFRYQAGAFLEQVRIPVLPGPSPVLRVDLDDTDDSLELVVVDAFADSVSVYRVAAPNPPEL